MDPAILARFPALHTHLTATLVRGKVRELSTLLCFSEGGFWKVCLSDRDRALVAFMSGRTLLEAVESLEKALQEHLVDWRQPRRR